MFIKVFVYDKNMTPDIWITLAGIVISGLISFFIASSKIGEYKNKVNTVCTEISELKREVKELTTKLVECSVKIEERTRSYASTLTKSESPLSLTPQGQILLSQSGSDKFVLDNQADLIKKIEEKNPHSAYDIQVYAKQVIEETQNEVGFKPLKDFAFNKGIDLEPIILVMSIFLRDIALPSLGHKKEDVDKTAPQTATVSL